MSGIKGRKNISYEDSHKIMEGGEIYKLCNCHNDWFPNEDAWFPMTNEYFYKNDKNKKDGFNPICKKCTIKKSSKWIKNNPEKFSFFNNRNNKRKQTKENKFRYSIKQRSSGMYKRWQQENKSKVNKYNYERFSNKKHTITTKEWQNCKMYFNMKCAYCELPIEEHYYTRNGITKLGDFHKEHVNCEGVNDLSNCVPSCKKCNSSKHNSNFEEWYNKENPIYSEERYNKIHKWLNEDYKLYIKQN